MGIEIDHFEDFILISATSRDVDDIRRLVLDYGNTPWHSFPSVDLEKHLIKIASGKDLALLTFDADKLVGMVSFTIGSFYLEYEPETSRKTPTGYIVEILVHPACAKRGIGMKLLEGAIAQLLERGVHRIYAKRHEENRASEAVMRKSGFKVIDVFHDPRRTTGSCRTVIECFSLKL